jgi:hypothetical protein
VAKIVVGICFMGFVIFLTSALSIGFLTLSITVMEIQLNVPQVLIFSFVLVIYIYLSYNGVFVE